MHSRSSLENNTRFQTKMGKVYSRFQTKKAQKPYPLGRDIPYYMEFSLHVNFAIQKKNREIKVTRTMSVAKIKWLKICPYKERTSLLSLKRLQITLFTFLRNFQCKLMWSIDSRTIIHVLKHELLVNIVRTALLLYCCHLVSLLRFS